MHMSDIYQHVYDRYVMVHVVTWEYMKGMLILLVKRRILG